MLSDDSFQTVLILSEKIMLKRKNIFQVFLSLCEPNFVKKKTEFTNNSRTRLKSGFFQVHFKYQNFFRTFKEFKNWQPTMRFEVRSFSHQNMKEMENRRVGGKQHITVTTNWKSLDGF